MKPIYAGSEIPAPAAGVLTNFSFALLGIFPMAAKRIVDFFRARRVYAKWPKPSRFDRNLARLIDGIEQSLQPPRLPDQP